MAIVPDRKITIKPATYESATDLLCRAISDPYWALDWTTHPGGSAIRAGRSVPATYRDVTVKIENNKILSIRLGSLSDDQVEVRIHKEDEGTDDAIEYVVDLLSQLFTIVDDAPKPDLTRSTEHSHKPDPRLDILSESDRRIVTLRSEGHTASEIADVVGLEKQSVYNKAGDIRKILIENYGEDAADELIPRLR